MKLLLTSLIVLLFTQVLQAQDSQEEFRVVFNFYQTSTNNATLQVLHNDILLDSLHLSANDNIPTPIIINDQKVGDCRINTLLPDTMALTVNFLQESAIYVDLNIKALAHTHLKIINQRDDTTRWQPIKIEKFPQLGMFMNLGCIKTDRSPSGLRRHRLMNAVDGFRNGLAVYQDEYSSLYGLIDRKGNLVQNTVYDVITPLEQYWIVSKDGKSGLADSKGQLLYPVKCENIYALTANSVLLTPTNDSVIVMDMQTQYTKRFAPTTTINTYTLNPNRFIVSQNGLSGLIDAKGNWVIPCSYSNMNWVSDVYLGVQKNGTWYGIIDTSGAIVLPIRYDAIYPPQNTTSIDDNVFSVQQDKLWGLLRKDNTFLVPPTYNNALMPMGDYWQTFDSENHTTVLDSTGKKILSLPYYLMYGFTPPRTQVVLNGKYGYIDAQGKEIIPCIAERLLCFYYAGNEDKAIPTTKSLIISNRKCGVVDNNGKFILPLIYDQILPQNADPIRSPHNYNVAYYIVGQNQKVGVANAKGQITIPIQYDAISFACNNLVRLYASRDTKCGWATADGKIYTQPKLSTQTCQYYEQKAVTYPTYKGCENATRGMHPCDPIPLPCYQCEQECPDEQYLKKLLR